MVNPLIGSSVFSDADGDAHASSSWEVYDNASLAGPALVWSKAADSINLTLIAVTAANGGFSNGLAGKTALAQNTDYFVRVRYTDGRGAASTFSPASRFTTGITAWARTFGGAGVDAAAAIRGTSDGGFVVAGTTQSFGAGSGDVWVLKLTSSGSVAWQRTFGGAGADSAADVHQTADGGFIVAGSTESFGAGASDVWVLKLDQDGAVVWQKTYGGSDGEIASSIQQTADGGYVLAGSRFSVSAGGALVLKLSPGGDVEWGKTYSDISDLAKSVQQTADGAFIVAGATSYFGAGFFNMWVLKLNADGSVVWQKTYGGTGTDMASSIEQTTDGGYVVAGSASSFSSTGRTDAWVVKLDSNGLVQWQKTYGGADASDGSVAGSASAVHQTTDGGFVVGGFTFSLSTGGGSAWISKLNADGTLAWQNAFPGFDTAVAVRQISSGRFIACGSTSSPGAGSQDFWTMKLNADGTVPPLGVATAVIPQDTSIVAAASAAAVRTTSDVGTASVCIATSTNCTVTQVAP